MNAKIKHIKEYYKMLRYNKYELRDGSGLFRIHTPQNWKPCFRNSRTWWFFDKLRTFRYYGFAKGHTTMRLLDYERYLGWEHKLSPRLIIDNGKICLKKNSVKLIILFTFVLSKSLKICYTLH